MLPGSLLQTVAQQGILHRHPPYCLPSALQLLTTSSPDRAPQQITDSGALATRLLEACLNAGLGVSEFDEMLSDEIASIASDDDVGESGMLSSTRLLCCP